MNIGPDAGWFAYTPLSGPQFSPGTPDGRLGADDHFHRDLCPDHSDRDHHDISETARARDVAEPHTAVLLGDVCSVLDGDLRHAVRDGRERYAAARPHDRYAFLQPGGRTATRCFGSTCSGSSAIRRCTSSSFQRRDSSRRSCRRWCAGRIFGYVPLVLSLITTAFISFGLWVHHMFATGLPQLADTFFTAASLMIAIPNAVQIFCWVAAMWLGRPQREIADVFPGRICLRSSSSAACRA